MAEGMAYHYTSRANLWSILTSGIRPGSELFKKEQLPYVMASLQRYDVVQGAVYIEFDLGKIDPSVVVRQVNDAWIEIVGTVPAAAIVSVAIPPTNMQIVDAVLNGGTAAVDALFALAYKPAAEVLAAVEAMEV